MNNEKINNREVIPYETNRMPDTDLAEGEELILIHGQDGLRIVDDEGNTVNEIEAVSQVVAYGPKNRVIPAGSVRTPNSDLDEGVENFISEGFTGLQLLDENGEVIQEYPAIAENIEYGPIREAVSFERVRKPNNDLEEGQEDVLVSGEEGLQLVDEEGNATLVEEPRTEELEYGPKRLPVPFEVERNANNDLPEGETQLVISGENGLELEDEEGNITRISDPVAEVVEYGPIRHSIPFETKRVSNSVLDEGQEKVLVSGEEGLQLEDKEGQITLVSIPVNEEIEYGPIRHYFPFETIRMSNPDLAEGEEIVNVAGKDAVQLEDEEGNKTDFSNSVTEEIEYGPARQYIPFETKRVSNSDLAEGEENLVVSGEEGLQLKDEEEQIRLISIPVNEEIEYGPIRHSVSFETERAVNVDLAEGEEQLATSGEEGIKIEDEEGNISDFIRPVTQVVDYGPVRISLPFETVRTVNTELTQDEEQLVTEGQEGVQLKDESGNTVETHDPITEEIEYGPAYQVVSFETLRYPYLDLEEGDVIPLTQGINGLKLFDEKGNVIENYESIPEEVAYGPDKNEREELEAADDD